MWNLAKEAKVGRLDQGVKDLGHAAIQTKRHFLSGTTIAERLTRAAENGR